MLLTKRQRNEIFEKIAACGVDPKSCNLKDPTSWLSPTEAQIRHKPSRSTFGLRVRRRTYRALPTVGNVYQGRSSLGDWSDLLNRLMVWAREVAYEIDTPDLWAELRQVPEILATAQSPDASNEPFTADEQADISTRIDRAKDAVRQDNPELTTEQMSAIEQMLDEIKDASTRVGRKDWVMMANGALLGLIVNDLVPPHVVQSVFNMLITGIAHIFGIGGPPPIITA